MNKWLTILMSFYLLALACMPCVCDDVMPAQANTHQHQKQEKHNTTKEDNCNPFCICSCCVSVVFTSQHNQQIFQQFFYTTPKQTVFNSLIYASYNSHNIWQPPKV